MSETKSPFAPLSYDLIQNSPESNAVLGKLVSGEIKVLRLFRCDEALFNAVRQEVMDIVASSEGETLKDGHPTFDYVTKWDPNWKPKSGAVRQFSLYNTRDKMDFFDEDHHWFDGRRFNSALKRVPEFFREYFRDTELQNFRIQAVSSGGDLGLHRERIIAIPKREQHYKLRFHLPIVTNPGVKFLMDGQSFRMEAGSAYLFNQYCMHGMENVGSELRVHLVWDCYLNDYVVNELIGPAWNSQGLQAKAS